LIETDEVIERETDTRPEAPGREHSRRAGFVALVVLIAGAVVLGLAIYSGIRARAADETRLKLATAQAAIPTVNVIHARPGAALQELVLPGNTQPFVDAPIYARTSGYVKKWYFDIGARVKQGQLLAEIETPEVDQQLQQARADLETAKSNLELAKLTADRYEPLLKSGVVSQQLADQATSDFSAKRTAVDSAAANVRRLEQLQSFEKVHAPFDGIITARNTDTGALIDAGSAAQAKELFHLASLDKLRVFVGIPETYSRAALPGARATLTLEEFPGETFTGVLARSANSIDPASRTLMVEVDVDNSRGRLLPGSYAFVHLKLPKQIKSVTLPSNALLFRSEGLRVAVVREGKAELVPITIGRDYGAEVEVVSGIGMDDAVILDPADSLVSGTPVQVNERQPESPAQ
jgi:RND family efflux transporter MFP subunit